MTIREFGIRPDRQIGKPYQDLPKRTQVLLEGWNYGNVRPPEVRVPKALPSVSFMIADIKLPTEGSARILELGGLGSHLDAYPDGPGAVADRIYQVLASLDVPVRVITPFTLGDAFAAMGGGPTGAARTLIGADIQAAVRTYGIRFPENGTFQRKLEAKQSGRVMPLADLREAKALMWSHQSEEDLASIDTSRVVLVNPPEVAALIDDKAATQQFFEQHGLTDIRPASWVIPHTSKREDIERMVAAAPELKRFVLKPVGLSGGRGVEVLERTAVTNRLGDLLANQHKTDDPEDKDFYLTNTLAYGGSVVLEEYIPSKPVKLSGKEYDGTMRIAVMTVVNNGKATIVPVAAYWKLPVAARDEGWTTESVVSAVLGRDEASARVAPEDFQRAFASVTKAVSEVVKLAHTAPRIAKAPKPYRPSYASDRFRGKKVEDPQVGSEYVMSGKKVRYLGMQEGSWGRKQLAVEYLDNERSDYSFRRGERQGNTELLPEWFADRLCYIPAEDLEEF